MASFKAWREIANRTQLRKHVEKIKIAGRPPVMQNRGATVELDEEEELEEIEEPAPPTAAERGPAVIQFHENRQNSLRPRSSAPKIQMGPYELQTSAR